MDVLDHKNLDKDVKFFRNCVRWVNTFFCSFLNNRTVTVSIQAKPITRLDSLETNEFKTIGDIILRVDVLTFSTTENVALFIWQSLCEQLPDPKMLYEVKVHETDKNVVTFRGEFVN